MQSHGDMGDLVKLNSLWAARICGVLEPRGIPACARRGICNVLEPRAFPGVLSGMAAAAYAARSSPGKFVFGPMGKFTIFGPINK